MVLDYVWISNFHLHSLVIANIAETYCVPLCEDRQIFLFFLCSCTAKINPNLPTWWKHHLTLCTAKLFSSFSRAFFAFPKASKISFFFRSASTPGSCERSRAARASLHRNSASSLDERKSWCDTASARRKQRRGQPLRGLSQKSLALRLEGFLFFFVTV